MMRRKGTLIWLLVSAIALISCSHLSRTYPPPGIDSVIIKEQVVIDKESNQTPEHAINPQKNPEKQDIEEVLDNYHANCKNDLISDDNIDEQLPIRGSFSTIKNSKTEEYIKKALSRHKNYYIGILNRFEKIRPQIESILEDNGVPKDLAYLAFVESAGNPHALSPSGAGGYWQFLPGTGKLYGLKIDSWIDERKHLEKSTKAAAMYLKDLYGMFNDWLLVCAAYNAGETAILKIMKKYPDVRSFWDITPDMIYKYETIAFVPKILAAIQIGKNREDYSIPEPLDSSPTEFEILKVDYPVAFEELSILTGKSVSSFTALNPELKKMCTPPYMNEYVLRVPTGTADMLALALESKDEKSVKKISGELYLKYGENKQIASKDFRKKKPSIADEKKKNLIAIKKYTGTKDSNIITHKVMKGDTVWNISKRYEVKPQDIKKWNQLGTRSNIHPGDKLTIYLD